LNVSRKSFGSPLSFYIFVSANELNRISKRARSGSRKTKTHKIQTDKKPNSQDPRKTSLNPTTRKTDQTNNPTKDQHKSKSQEKINANPNLNPKNQRPNPNLKKPKPN